MGANEEEKENMQRPEIGKVLLHLTFLFNLTSTIVYLNIGAVSDCSSCPISPRT